MSILKKHGDTVDKKSILIFQLSYIIIYIRCSSEKVLVVLRSE